MAVVRDVPKVDDCLDECPKGAVNIIVLGDPCAIVPGVVQRREPFLD
eukprot:CAMPEP_0184454568 /NCGR_PEP_ID=MMETSP0740-20130409/20468_1 /TAXON_ID=385413 /ORGANISM="Thalassiosira miniscula, Strain CCMP1093" /LENGTH=46 /DNA_ID= /DNA_START= /DNA_END= /DNA_ORIENTATION=